MKKLVLSSIAAVLLTGSVMAFAASKPVSNVYVFNYSCHDVSINGVVYPHETVDNGTSYYMPMSRNTYQGRYKDANGVIHNAFSLIVYSAAAKQQLMGISQDLKINTSNNVRIYNKDGTPCMRAHG